MLLLIEFEKKFELCVRSHYLLNINLLLWEYNLISKNSALVFRSGQWQLRTVKNVSELRQPRHQSLHREVEVCIVVPKSNGNSKSQRGTLKWSKSPGWFSTEFEVATQRATWTSPLQGCTSYNDVCTTPWVSSNEQFQSVMSEATKRTR